ncbi:hypothetical protein TEA_026013 [Camellia sinensis var. sinensis]|uniref:Protein kinase domain-containing protein n=1 Tax=Camellia sinensis var. sinensis TaxID=542762 RepID=A0A4S4DQV4_CAMSN|nr:hypothetical protein TEA_026013 [Camellia sinensis var. sinensis]
MRVSRSGLDLVEGSGGGWWWFRWIVGFLRRLRRFALSPLLHMERERERLPCVMCVQLLVRLKGRHRWVKVDSGDNSEKRNVVAGCCCWKPNGMSDIITGIYQLHSQKYWHGDLSITDILIVNDRAKFAFLRGARGGSPDKRGEDFEKLRKAESGETVLPSPSNDSNAKVSSTRYDAYHRTYKFLRSESKKRTRHHKSSGTLILSIS